MLQVDTPEIEARRAEILHSVADVAVPFSWTTPHVTVFVHGFDRPPNPSAPALQLPVSIGGVGAFQTCVFLEARCPGLADLRAQFGGNEHRWTHYLPHLTVARFERPAIPREIGIRLRPFHRLSPILCTGRLSLMAVDAWRDDGLLTPAGQLPDALPATAG